MAKKFWSRPVLVVFGLVFFALIGFVLLTQPTAAGSGEVGDSWMARLHQHLSSHGSGHGDGHGMGMGKGMHHRMGHFIEELDLSEDQSAHLAALHHTLLDGLANHGEGRALQRDQLLAAVQSGTLSRLELEQLIDGHLADFKTVAYQAAEPLAALINSFDEEQRGKMVAHIQALHGDDS